MGLVSAKTHWLSKLGRLIPWVEALKVGVLCAQAPSKEKKLVTWFCWNKLEREGGKHAYQFFQASGSISVSSQVGVHNKLIVRLQLEKYAVITLSGKNWDTGISFLLHVHCTKFGYKIAAGCVHMPFNNYFFLCYDLMGLKCWALLVLRTRWFECQP